MNALVLLVGLGVLSYGPVNSISRTEPNVQVDRLSFDKTGTPDVFWRQRWDGPAPTKLPAEPPIAVSCTLPDGRVFTSDFAHGPSTLLASGPYTRTLLHWSMLYSPGSQPILGAHLFTTVRADGFIEESLGISNGAVKPGDNSTFCGAVYYSDLRVTLTAGGKKIVTQARAGQAWDQAANALVIAKGGGHLFPERAQLWRRFVVYPRNGLMQSDQGAAAKDVLDLADIFYPPTYKAFGPSKSVLPARPDDGSAQAEFDGLSAACALGAQSVGLGLMHSAMGPFQPHGRASADDVGGDGIEFVPWELSRAGARLRRFRADLRAERTPLAVYDRDTGIPLLPVDWAKGGDSQGFEYRLTRGYSGIVQIPCFAALSDSWVGDHQVFVHKRFNAGVCAYESDLYSYLADDDAHFSRAYRDDKANWWLSRDWPSWLRLKLYAADIETSWTQKGMQPFTPTYPGQWTPFSLQQRLLTQAIGQGGFYGRAVGWPIDEVVAHTCTLGPGSARDVQLSWLTDIGTLLGKAVMPTGLAYHGEPPSADNGVPWYTDNLALTKGEAPVFQVPILVQGVTDAWASTNTFQPAVVTKLVCASAMSLYRNPSLHYVQSEYGGSAVGPPWYVVVANGGAPVSVLSEGVGNSHWMHCLNHLADAYRVSQDASFIQAMLQVGVPVATLQQRLAGLNDPIFNTEAKSVLGQYIAAHAQQVPGGQ